MVSDLVVETFVLPMFWCHCLLILKGGDILSLCTLQMTFIILFDVRSELLSAIFIVY